MTFFVTLLMVAPVRGSTFFRIHFGRFVARSSEDLAYAILMVLFFGISQMAFAQTEYSDISTTVWNPDELTIDSKQMDRKFSGDVHFEQMQYSQPYASNTALDQQQDILGRFRFDHSGPVTYGFDVIAFENATVNTSHYGVNELYISSSKQATWTFVAGRKLADWSKLDADWHLGIWQPTFTQIDSLRIIDEGLSGFFSEYHDGKNEILFFATPIFIPSMGPNVTNNNGSLTSDSRWYTSPSNTYPYQGVNTQVIYNLQTPQIGNLIAHPGAGLHYVHEKENSEGVWWGASAGFKPMNAVLLKYNPYLQTGNTNTNVQVQVTPDVGYHEVGGFDLGYKKVSDQYALSFLADHPEDVTPSGNWIQQRPEPFQSAGFYWHHQFNDGWQSKLEYLRILGGRIHDVDQTGQNQGALFDQRFLFYNSVSTELDNEARWWGKKVESSVRYLRDFDQQGSMVNAEFKFYPTTQIYISLGLDVLSVDNTEDRDSTFLNEFRGNDRYYGGVSYVF